MKIAVVYLGHKGAGPIFTLSLSNALSKHVEEIKCFLSSKISNYNDWTKSKLNVAFFNVPKTSRQIFHKESLKVITTIINEIIHFNPDAIVFTMIHPFNFIIGNYLRKKGYTVLSLIHDPQPHEGEKFWVRLIQKLELKSSDIFFTLSNFSKFNLKKITKKPVENYLHPIMDISSVSEKPPEIELEILKNKFVFLYFGRIEPYKGLNNLVEAFSSLVSDKKFEEKTYLIVAGAGNLDKTTNQKLNELEKRKLACFINRFLKDSEILELINISNIAVLPYLSASQSGVLSTIYYYGKPAIVTPVGGLLEQSLYGTGSLITLPNSLSLLDSMKFILENENIYNLLLEEVRSIRKNLPTWNGMALEIIDFIRANLKKK
jgi:glycosyltransferase involved in cell wall biosynthesis